VVHSTSMISASAALHHLFGPRVRVGSEAADRRHRIAARIIRRGERHNRYFTPMPCSRRRPRALLAPALRGCTHPRAMLQPPLDQLMDGLTTAQTRLFPCLKDNYSVLVHDPAAGATAAEVATSAPLDRE
jgi:hypothetical protein